MVPEAARPLGPRQFWAIATGLLLILIGALFVLGPSLAERYVLEVQGRPLEKAFGFRSAYLPVTGGRVDGRVFAITEIVPGGSLDRAGFRVGDQPSVGFCLFQGDYVAAKAFFDRLEQVRSGESVTFSVANAQRGAVWQRVVLQH